MKPEKNLTTYLPNVLTTKNPPNPSLKKGGQKAAFTLAEVLITLAIVGVVAAMTVPTLVSNHQKKVLVNQLKKSYSLLNQTFRSAMAADGVDDLADTQLFSVWLPCGSFRNECNQTHMNKFIYELNRHAKVEIDKSIEYGPTSTPIITLGNGSIIRRYSISYGPKQYDNEECQRIKALGGKYCSQQMTMTIDINGNKGPNTSGRDIFEFEVGDNGILYPKYGKDYALRWSQTPLESNPVYWKNTYRPCQPYEEFINEEYKNRLGTDGCAARIMEEGWQMNY